MSRLGTANRTGSVELLYSRHQHAFLEALDQRTRSGAYAYKSLALFSGRRAGKTTIGALATAKKMTVPNRLIWVCGATYRDLKDVVIPELFRWTPERWIADWRESDLEMIITNGTRVQCRSLEDPNTARGPGLDFAWIDEARKVQQLAWDTMVPALSDKGGQAIFTTTPNAYDWCYEKLWVPAAVDPQPGFWACKYRTADAPHFQTPAGRAELEHARRTLDPIFFAQEYEADFVTFTGAIYGAVWSDQLVLRNDQQIRELIPEWPQIHPSRECIIGLDPGTDHPFAMVLIVITERGLVVVGEYLERNRAAVDHVQGFGEVCGAYNPLQPFRPERWAIDKSQAQWAIELAQYGVMTLPANNDVLAGINRVRAWLRSRQLFFIESRCPRLLKELRGYVWDESKNEHGEYKREQPKKIADDLPDALRYALMLYPELPSSTTIELTDRDRAIALMTPEQQWAIARNRRCEKLIQRPTDEDAGLIVYGDDEELEPWGEDIVDINQPMGSFFG